MGLTNIQRGLIRAIVSDNKTPDSVKSMALLVLREDTTAKNKAFCQHAITLLEKKKGIADLVSKNKNIIVEDVSDFIEARYYLSTREKDLFAHIDKIRHVSQKMREMKIRYLNTVLLHGESGTGKTTFGRYLAYKFGLPFVYINFSTLVGSFLGETPKNIASVFADVRDVPCVLMLDEIDCVATRRDQSGTGANQEMNRVVITILQELDRADSGMIIVAATNRFDMLDDAIIRRFSVHHEVQRLSLEESRMMIRNYIHDLPMDIDDMEVDRVIEQFNGKDVAQSYLINALIERVAEILFKKA